MFPAWNRTLGHVHDHNHDYGNMQSIIWISVWSKQKRNKQIQISLSLFVTYSYCMDFFVDWVRTEKE